MNSDEGFTWRLVQYDWSELVYRTAQDVHPPLHYLVAKAWSELFGISLLSLRLLSVLISLASVVLIYRISRRGLERISADRFASQAGGLLAATALAFHPLQLEVSSTARMYALGVFLSLLSTALLLEIQASGPRRNILAVLYGITGAALCYTHNFGLLVVAAQMSYTAAYFWCAASDQDKAVRRSLCAAYLVLAAAYLPWIAATTRQFTTLSRGYWIDDLTVMGTVDLMGGWILGASFTPLEEDLFVLAVLGIIVLVSLARGSGVHLQLLTESTFPWFAVIVVFLLIGQGFALLRCFTFALASLILVGTLTLPTFQNHFIRFLMAALFFVPMLWYGAREVITDRVEWDSNRGVIDVVDQHWRKQDVIVVPSVHHLNLLRYHAAADCIESFDVRAMVSPFAGKDRHRVHAASVAEEELITTISALDPARFKRLWVFAYNEQPREENTSGWRRVQTWRLPNSFTLGLYDARVTEAR
jgi:uncharacterized membrane protein